MRRYFFHVRGDKESRDTDGHECADLQQVKAEAIRTTGETLKDLGPEFWKHGEWTMWVEDERGATVLLLEFFATSPLLTE